MPEVWRERFLRVHDVELRECVGDCREGTVSGRSSRDDYADTAMTDAGLAVATSKTWAKVEICERSAPDPRGVMAAGLRTGIAAVAGGLGFDLRCEADPSVPAPHGKLLMTVALPPGSTARVHRHLDIGKGDRDAVFGRPAEVGFDGIMTACVFAWEEKAEESSRFMLAEMKRHIARYWTEGRPNGTAG